MRDWREEDKKKRFMRRGLIKLSLKCIQMNKVNKDRKYLGYGETIFQNYLSVGVDEGEEKEKRKS